MFGTQVYNNFDDDAFNAEFGGFESSGIDDGLLVGFQNFQGENIGLSRVFG